MKFIDYIHELSDGELKDMFNEYINYRKVGTLPETAKIRSLRNKIVNEIFDNDQFWDMGCNMICDEICFEIACRHYNVQ